MKVASQVDGRFRPESGNESSFVLVLFFSVVDQERSLILKM
jgi:hypothetical protein